MTYTRPHTRPSQKDLGCVVYPLNIKSLGNTVEGPGGVLMHLPQRSDIIPDIGPGLTLKMHP
jgi:hypothetical protein